MRLTILCLLASVLFSSATLAQDTSGVPVFKVVDKESTIKFEVDASVEIVGIFDKWDATLTLTSPDVKTAVLNIDVQAASVDTGSSIKNNTLKGKNFFYVDQNPLITFSSTKIVQTGPATFEVDGNFTIRGVTRPERLTLAVSGVGTGSGVISGTMAFDRRNYGMNSGIPFIKVANRVQVTANLKFNRVSGPPVVLQQ